MSVFTAIDRRLRHSFLARAQPVIRARLPWLHKALIAGRDVVLPYRSRNGLTRYQNAAIERFCEFASDRTGAVLEIGSDLEGSVLRELADRRIAPLIGLNVDVRFSGIADENRPRRTYSMVQGDARRLPLRDATVSSIVSIMAFEHIEDLGTALREMHRVLKPNGIVYADFGPIWSCSVGHHVFASVDGIEARHWKPGKNPVPHHAHLLMSPEALRGAVLGKSWVTPKLADAIVEWIFVGHGINRVFFEDYVRAFNESPFQVRHLVPLREHVPSATQAALEKRWPGYREFDVRMIEVVLHKP